MKTGAIVSTGVAVLATTAMVFAFMSSASPYVNVAQAREMRGRRLHLAGDILKNSARADLAGGKLSFRLKDERGEVVTVVHRGDPPANMAQATKVVAVGTMKGDEFHSAGKLLIKCPSKYEDEAVQTQARN